MVEKIIVKAGTSYKLVPESEGSVDGENDNEGVTLVVNEDGDGAILTEFRDGQITASNTLTLA